MVETVVLAAEAHSLHHSTLELLCAEENFLSSVVLGVLSTCFESLRLALGTCNAVVPECGADSIKEECGKVLVYGSGGQYKIDECNIS